MYKKISIFFLCLFTCMLCGCMGRKDSDDKKLKVVTTIFAPYDYVREIAGDEVSVSMLLKPGEESHSFDPSPQDIIEINECDLFIYNGGENDEWIDDVLDSVNDDVQTLRMMDCIDDLYIEEEIFGEEHGHSHKEHEEYDEHVWASPVNAVKIVNGIAAKLSKLDSAHSDIYESNRKEYTDRLLYICSEIEDIVANSKRKLIVFGDRFPLRYFVEEFGLDYYAAFPGCAEDTETSPQVLVKLIDIVKKNDVPVVFKTELSNGNIAKTLSEATGAKVRTFYTCHNITKDDYENGLGYIDMMGSNAELLREALN